MTQASQAAVFLGSSIYSCLGKGVEANLQALQQPAEAPTLHLNQTTDETLQIPYKLLGDAPLQNPEERLYKLIEEVAQQALDEAQVSEEQRRTMGLFIGSSSFDLSVWETRYQRDLAQSEHAVALRNGSISILADYLVRQMDLRGQDYSFNTACTASANALMAAVTQVEAGVTEFALVIGVELYNEVSALGFNGLGLLTRSVMLPFDEARDGLVLGEGISALVVGRAPADERQRFSLRGAANFSDTHSISAAAPDGSTIAKVMEWALESASMGAQDVTAVKVHGTASLSNDEAEAAGMHRVFSSLPPLCALKPHLGHTLGACGLNELILFYRAIEAGFLIATPGISASEGDLEITLNQQQLPLREGNFMLNYFGFGGNNTSLIISNVGGAGG